MSHRVKGGIELDNGPIRYNDLPQKVQQLVDFLLENPEIKHRLYLESLQYQEGTDAVSQNQD